MAPASGKYTLGSADHFEAFFKQATAHSPLPYQTQLATGERLPSLLDVPTGLGKTAAAVLAWIWRRRFAADEIRNASPRRLIYCLPMRVLVEQTYLETIKWLDRLGLLAGEAKWTAKDNDSLPSETARLVRRDDGTERGYSPSPETETISPEAWAMLNGQFGRHPIPVHLLLGGEERSDWALWPERDAILIGTQDMLISRALNRGYAAGRARWPMEFGILNNDCLWIFDEVQIMDTGLATSLQFDAWRRSLSLRIEKSQLPTPVPSVSQPCLSLWMSATMAKHWLERAIDWSSQVENAWSTRQRLQPNDEQNERVGQLLQNTKQIEKAPIKLEKPKTKDKTDAARKESDYLDQVANHIRKNRSKTGLTLIIVNTVDRAVGLFNLLQKIPDNPAVNLMHSRFRPFERERWVRFLKPNSDDATILVSTQVIEAGVDLSADVLYTELAPWASLVQRFGRCARYPGQSGKVFWLDLDIDKSDHWAKPYGQTEIIEAKKSLIKLKDVGLNSLTKIDLSAELSPYEPRFVPRAKDLFDLFDTTPDLTGADVDVSRFIRDGEELDVQVFWRIVTDAGPTKGDQPARRELCPVPFHRFRQALPDLLKAGKVWRRSYRKRWELLTPRSTQAVYPGQIFLLQSSCGGYSKEIGWTGNTTDTDFILPDPICPGRETVQDEEDDSDELSHLSQPEKWLTVFEHTYDVCQKLDQTLADINLPEQEKQSLRLAARWHDRGKAHCAFQSKLRLELLSADKVKQKLNSQPAAKAPDKAWKRGCRIGFRHELASALAILETLHTFDPNHPGFAWPNGLNKSDFGKATVNTLNVIDANDPLAVELALLSSDELDLLVYLVASHHGKVRMSIRSSPDDETSSDDVRQARGVRDNDQLPKCEIPSSTIDKEITAPTVTIHLDLMDLGLSDRYGASWRERTQLLLERLGPFKLAYLEALLRAADCRASMDEDQQDQTTKAT